MKGSCLCGAVRYESGETILEMAHCHCTDCRKAHGAAFATFVDVPTEEFRFTSGEDRLEHYRIDNGAIRSFCRTCGSLMTWTHVDRRHRKVSFTAATLDTPLDRRADLHVFVRSKVPWYDIGDDAPQHDTYPKRD